MGRPFSFSTEGLTTLPNEKSSSQPSSDFDASERAGATEAIDAIGEARDRGQAGGPTYLGLLSGTVALVIATSAFAIAHWLEQASAHEYYAAVQEDEVLEWITTWAFLFGAGFAFLAARRTWLQQRGWPWFTVGVGLFCFLVAMEEISWGQRILGYQPPTYFLEFNYQQELNVHNVVSTDLRMLTMKIIILGYGVILPVLGLVPLLRRFAGRVGVLFPPLSLAPAFALAYWVYSSYPWSHSGEWVEAVVGLGFMFSMLAAFSKFRTPSRSTGTENAKATASLLGGSASKPSVSFVVWVSIVVACLGSINAAISRNQRSSNPELLETAAIEVEALRRDFASGRASTLCNMHQRIFTFMTDKNAEGLLSGQFSALQEYGLPESRANFFLDPWNSPYWIRDRCSKSRGLRLTFIYSFGPNRQRDSSRYEILGDDIGVWIRQRPLD